MKNDLVGVITKIHILQNHVTFQLDIIRGTLSFMEMFPCPAAGTFLGFGENAVFLFCVDKSNVAFVHFDFSSRRSKIRLAPARAITILLNCWLTWLMAR